MNAETAETAEKMLGAVTKLLRPFRPRMYAGDHIVPWLAMRRTACGSGPGRWRWVVERTFAWLSRFRRLRVRSDRRADIHEAFLSLGCALICRQSLRKSWKAA
jgi:transposase